MAKPIKKERKLISSLSNLEQVEKGNDDIQEIEKNTKSSYNIQIRIHQEWIDKFRHLHTYFLGMTENYKDYKHMMSFFSMVVKEFIENLKKDNKYYEADNEFIKYVTRKGQRKKGDRTSEEQDKMRGIIFGKYDVEDSTKQLWEDLTYSLAKRENMVNMLEYSSGYFLIDLINFVEEEKEKLIKKYKNLH